MISDTTDPTALLPPDHPDRLKVTPDSGGLRYVFNQLIGTATALLYPHVQSRSPKNAIPLPEHAKRAPNRYMSLFFSALSSPLVFGPASAFTFPQNNKSYPFWREFMALEFGKIAIQNKLKEHSRSLAWIPLANTRGYLISILIAMGFVTDGSIDWLNVLRVYKD
ncbi:hypothetical protein O181_073132 [Austropuccinia psidii MF-1]|uniref:Uncharacterized protein n=1 Tax=Austropuccinia psidii MF-1 TaxID=1389203 RepID=A0A9Q3FAN6_9BASI|nr:hypothetical protein [Austropuccinia psidii MF-1]